MTFSTSSPRARQRWALLSVVVGGLVLLLATFAYARLINGFEIDAGEAAGLTAYYSGNDPAGSDGDDWAQGGTFKGVFTGAAGGPCYSSTISVNPTINGAAGVICDGTSDSGFRTLEPEASIVSPAGKTPDDVWSIKPGNNTPKNDVTHGYTLIREFDSPCVAGGSASDPDSLIVYLAGERLNNEGDSFWGFGHVETKKWILNGNGIGPTEGPEIMRTVCSAVPLRALPDLPTIRKNGRP